MSNTPTTETTTHAEMTPLLAGTNARGRFASIGPTVARLRSERAALFPQVLEDNTDAAFKVSILSAQLLAIEGITRQLQIEAVAEETRARLESGRLLGSLNERRARGTISAQDYTAGRAEVTALMTAT
jgi:hypothetical protein